MNLSIVLKMFEVFCFNLFIAASFTKDRNVGEDWHFKTYRLEFGYSKGKEGFKDV